jgi:hypothetical protein
MKTLKPVKFGWKELDSALNRLIDAINERSISVSIGGGIDIQESQNGVLLTASAASLGSAQTTGSSGSTTPATPGDGSPGKTPNGKDPIYLTINMVMETGTGYEIKQFYVLGFPTDDT